MNDLQFKEDGSPRFQEYDIVNLGRTGFVKVRYWHCCGTCEKEKPFLITLRTCGE